ncbi:MAG: CHAT domain-containing protein, partial [Acidobacteria bacterium]|nr:CHAT domain-containing protein [Acidobacteriota bacterium]
MSLPRVPGGRGGRDRGLDVLIRPDRRGGLELQCLPEIDGGAPEAFEPPVSAGQLPALLAALEAKVLESAMECDGAEALPGRHVRTGPASPPLDLDVDELAEKLYTSVFRPRIEKAYTFRQGGAAENPEGGAIRLRLALDPAEEEAAFLCSLPWELMTPPNRATPLALNPLRTVVRALKPRDASSPTLPWPQGEALRVLVAGAAPVGEAPLDLEAEVEAIQAAGRGYAMPDFEILLPASALSLRDRLMRQQSHVLHLMCHGDFDPQTGEGTLILVGERGGSDPRHSRELARLLAGCPHLRLVVLNACRGGQFPRRRCLDPCSGVAQTFIREGIPAVVAHQFPISDRAAIAFTGGLYSRLMSGESLEAAVAEGR